MTYCDDIFLYGRYITIVRTSLSRTASRLLKAMPGGTWMSAYDPKLWLYIALDWAFLGNVFSNKSQTDDVERDFYFFISAFEIARSRNLSRLVTSYSSKTRHNKDIRP